jgi:hypothetical protein
MRTISRAGLVLLILGVVVLLSEDATASPASTERVSVNSAGNEGNGASSDPAISADGRHVAFYSFASDLVAGDTNICGLANCPDVFVHDRQAATTTRVSVDSAGVEGNGESYNPAISADGRFVAFDSRATNLVSGDTNNSCDNNGDTVLDNCTDVFVHDLVTTMTTRVSVDSGGIQGNGSSWYPAISADGRFVAFVSGATNLVMNDTNGYQDVFVHDLQTGVTERANVSQFGNQANNPSGQGSVAISADGRFVSFPSFATNLTPETSTGNDFHVQLFVRDREVSVTDLVSQRTDGGPANGDSNASAISADGRFVAFDSGASNLVVGGSSGGRHVFVHDRLAQDTEQVSVDSSGNQANGPSYDPGVAATGRFVSFYSQASNLVAEDNNAESDIFVRDRQTGITIRASLSGEAGQGNNSSHTPEISSGGEYVAFRSNSTNLISGDTNNVEDIFVRDLGDADSDGEWDPFDPNDDNDLLTDATETNCGSDPLNPTSLPERLDTPGDDDGDTLVNEPLPPGAEAYDCDGDGYVGTAETHVGTSDQDPCGGTGWPSDLVPGGLQPNTLNVQDLGSFITPVRRFGKSPPHPDFDVRWDLVPGGTIGGAINLQDVAATIVGPTGYPPMFGGLRAFGRTCPWAP